MTSMLKVTKYNCAIRKYHRKTPWILKAGEQEYPESFMHQIPLKIPDWYNATFRTNFPNIKQIISLSQTSIILNVLRDTLPQSFRHFILVN